MSHTDELFLMAGIWALIAFALASTLFSSWPARMGFVVVAVGVPFWEVPFGYASFRSLCNSELELRVFEKIPPQKTVCADHPFAELAPYLVKYGFDFVEQRDRNGTIRKFQVGSDGKIAAVVIDKISSEYCVTLKQNVPMKWRIDRTDFLIVRNRDGAVVGRQSDFYWGGTYWQDAARPILGRGGDCRGEPLDPIAKTLRNGAS